MKLITRHLIGITLAALVSNTLQAMLVSYTFETGISTPAAVAEDISASSFSLQTQSGPGSSSYVAGCAPTSVTAISNSDWRGAYESKWWQFTVTPASGSLLDLSSISFDDQRSSTGPTQWAVSINGTAATLNESTHSPFGRNTVDLSGSGYQGLGNATICIYGYSGSGASGTWRIDNVSLDGATTPVPEPAGYACIAGLGLVVFVWVRRMRRA